MQIDKGARRHVERQILIARKSQRERFAMQLRRISGNDKRFAQIAMAICPDQSTSPQIPKIKTMNICRLYSRERGNKRSIREFRNRPNNTPPYNTSTIDDLIHIHTSSAERKARISATVDDLHLRLI